MKICAIVVTYNRKKMLEKCLNALLNQTKKLDAIFVIDNASTDGTDTMIKNKFSQINYKRLSENTGGAGGFYEGIKTAYKDGFDWIWGMDDDAIADRKAFAMLVKESENNKDIKAFCSNPNNDQEFKSNTKEVEDWLFVGFFINRIIIKEIGLPKKEFFIYHDDTEYAYRIQKKGYKIKKVRNSIINHLISVTTKQISRKFLWKNLTFIDLPDWKLYYYVRNYIMSCKYSDKRKYKILCHLLWEFMLLNYIRSNQSKIFLHGFFDGLINKSGKVYLPK